VNSPFVQPIGEPVPRIIVALTMRNGRLVRTVRFRNPTYVGDPIVAVKIFNDKGTDELILLEIGEKPLDDQRLEELKGIATEAFMPISYGGGIRTGHELKMFIPGGASAPWFFPEQVDLPLEGRVIGGEGSMLGSGAVVVMDETTDAVRACLRVVRFFARESCGKCAPCREGTTWEEKILQRILDGHGRPSDIDLLLDVADNISPGPYPTAAHPDAGLEAVPFPPRQTTICPLGPSSVAPITSAIRRFRPEFEAKITKRDSIPVAAAPVAAPTASTQGHH
jgi:NADH:ubiquinone oxidoreductase subunit F (NADH-binding)